MLKRKNEEIKAVEMPPVKEYLREIQRDGSELKASEIYSETVEWLELCGVRNAISNQILEQYSFSVARWMHLEQFISKYGYVAKHPTTGAPMQSPYVAMAQAYMKQVVELREEINTLIKDAHHVPVAHIREVVYGGQ